MKSLAAWKRLLPTFTAEHMKVHIKPVCPEIMGSFSSGSYEVENSATVYEALIYALKQCGDEKILFDNVSSLVFFLNGKRVNSDAPINEGDSIMALRPAYGG